MYEHAKVYNNAQTREQARKAISDFFEEAPNNFSYTVQRNKPTLTVEQFKLHLRKQPRLMVNYPLEVGARILIDDTPVQALKQANCQCAKCGYDGMSLEMRKVVSPELLRQKQFNVFFHKCPQCKVTQTYAQGVVKVISS